MLVLWLLHDQITRGKTALIAGPGRATVQRYVAAFREGGLAGLRHWGVVGPASDMASHSDAIRASLTESPVRTVAEACDRIGELTGLRRKPTRVRVFLAGPGFRWQRIRALPVPPKKLTERVLEQREFPRTRLEPRPEAAEAGRTSPRSAAP